jgi:hypothetical protein
VNADRIIAVLESPSEEAILDLLGDNATVFWIDWRHEDETIADECESVLKTGALSGELVKVDSEVGFEVYLRYWNNRIKVPLTYSADDRHITLCALNRVLAPDFEVRFCVDSSGGDTLAFLPLRCDQWTSLERQYGEAVGRRFYRFGEKPNLFTDSIPFHGLGEVE